MRVECAFFGPLREAVGAKSVVRDTDVGTVRDLLADLETDYPGLDGRLLADGGETLSEDVAVTLNGRHVQHLEGGATGLSEGDVVRFTTAVYGG